MNADTPEEVSDRDFVGALARGLEVIGAFTRARPCMTVSEVARATGLARATVRRSLLTLTREGYAEKDAKHFWLTAKVRDLGCSASLAFDQFDVIQPVMNDLSRTLRRSVFAAVLSDEQVVYIARATPERLHDFRKSVGAHAPAHVMSTGRVLLAAQPAGYLRRYLDRTHLVKLTQNTITSKTRLHALIEEVRIDGFSVVDQELEVGVGSISVPVRDSRGQMIAALNVCCPLTQNFTQKTLKTILYLLDTSSQEITKSITVERK